MTHTGLDDPDAARRLNRAKQGIAFQEAAYLFLDPLVVLVQDRIEDGEERWQSIGMIAGKGQI
jgi:uncharacterized protein